MSDVLFLLHKSAHRRNEPIVSVVMTPSAVLQDHFLFLERVQCGVEFAVPWESESLGSIFSSPLIIMVPWASYYLLCLSFYSFVEEDYNSSPQGSEVWMNNTPYNTVYMSHSRHTILFCCCSWSIPLLDSKWLFSFMRAQWPQIFHNATEWVIVSVPSWFEYRTGLD